MSKCIRFKAQGSSSVLGNFGPGDIARNIPDAMADHFVKDAMCAEYLEAAPAAVPDAALAFESAQKTTAATKRGRKAQPEKE